MENDCIGSTSPQKSVVIYDDDDDDDADDDDKKYECPYRLKENRFKPIVPQTLYSKPFERREICACSV
jgi:hypothetical protein